MKFTLYTQDSKEKGKIELSDDIFAYDWKPALLKQVILAFLSNARTPIAHTKTRGEVRGGGRKPWKQKGTGRARHGSTRSPIWVGGGVTHGPRNDKNYSKKVNKKMRQAALKTALSKKAADGEILALVDMKFDEPKAKMAKIVLDGFAKISGFEKFATKKRNVALLVTPAKDESVEKSFSNFGNVFVKDAKNINAYDVARCKFVVLAGAEGVQNELMDRFNLNK